MPLHTLIQVAAAAAGAVVAAVVSVLWETDPIAPLMPIAAHWFLNAWASLSHNTQ